MTRTKTVTASAVLGALALAATMAGSAVAQNSHEEARDHGADEGHGKMLRRRQGPPERLQGRPRHHLRRHVRRSIIRATPGRS